MSYCINYSCEQRRNPEGSQFCQSCGTSLLVNDRYRLLRSLLKDSHPYTEVFEVQDTGNHDQKQVLKTLKSSNPIIIKLFEQEQELLESLGHPSIPEFKDSFSFVISHHRRRELRCFVMEKIEGKNLEEWLDDHQKIETEEIALSWLHQLASTLNYLHKQSFFHRDIKPSNIICKPDGTLVLIDFGTARSITETVIKGSKPITYVYSGGYTAPEQRNNKAVPQSDFYALGRTFVHLLTGTHPEEDELKLSQGLEQWKSKTNFPDSLLVKYVNKLLQETFRRRPKTADEITEQVEKIQTINNLLAEIKAVGNDTSIILNVESTSIEHLLTLKREEFTRKIEEIQSFNQIFAKVKNRTTSVQGKRGTNIDIAGLFTTWSFRVVSTGFFIYMLGLLFFPKQLSSLQSYLSQQFAKASIKPTSVASPSSQSTDFFKDAALHQAKSLSSQLSKIKFEGTDSIEENYNFNIKDGKVCLNSSLSICDLYLFIIHDQKFYFVFKAKSNKTFKNSEVNFIASFYDSSGLKVAPDADITTELPYSSGTGFQRVEQWSPGTVGEISFALPEDELSKVSIIRFSPGHTELKSKLFLPHFKR